MRRIVNASQLQALAEDMLRILDIRNRPDIAIAIAALSSEENRRHSDTINRLKSECGCFAGGIFMATSVLLVASYLIFNSAQTMPHGVGDWLQLAAFVAGAALFGKMLAVTWARARILLEIRHVLASLHGYRQ